MIGIDTNVLVYAFQDDATEHGAARTALDACSERGEDIVVPSFVLAEFVRVATHPRHLERAATGTAAVEFVDSFLGHAGVVVAPTTSGTWTRFAQLVVGTDARGNHAYDALVVGNLLDVGVRRILTNDRRMDRFPGIEVVPLVEA